MTATWKELGLSTEEIEDVKRPYVVRGVFDGKGNLNLKNIEAGGRAKIREVGFHTGDYGSWILGKSDKYLINAVGPKRAALLREGKINFTDLVDRKTGELVLLENLI